MLGQAHSQLMAIRQRQPDAGGLVIATDQDHVKGIAALLRDHLKVKAIVATSDDPEASNHISRYAAGKDPWIVAHQGRSVAAPGLRPPRPRLSRTGDRPFGPPVPGKLAKVRSVDPSLPGAELVTVGIADLREGNETVEALVVSMAATRLRQLGFDVPAAIPDPEHRLWTRLATDDTDGAHGRYNALVRRLVSFQRATCVS